MPGKAWKLARAALGAAVAGLLVWQAAAAFPTQAEEPPFDPALYPLLYQRDGSPADADRAAQVLIVGDTSFARGVERITAQHGADYPLEKASPWLRAADLAVGNYEGVIAAENEVIGAQRPGPYRLRAGPEAAAALARAGFGLVNLANNHTLDWGTAGLRVTLDHLHVAGIKTTGAGTNAADARQPLVTAVRGVNIVWLSFTLVPDPPGEVEHPEGWSRAWLRHDDSARLSEAVRAARALGDALIVQFHWGGEYALCPDAWQVRLAHAAIDAGAALVVGHHPHVVQQVELYGGGFIAYSLGNFLFDQDRAPGLGLWVRLDRAGMIDVRGLTLRPGLRPEWHAPAAAAGNLRLRCRAQAGQPTLFGYTAGQYGLLAGQAGPLPRRCLDDRAPRYLGLVDLRGDGEPEEVILQAGTLTIRKAGRTAYTSHPSWYVVDAALGDPNQDGRFEVLMLLWKQETPTSPVTTHPFILGFRRGEYQIIWGGSATAHWLQAVGVEDVDADRLDELITIERDPGALLCEARYRVLVLKWNGWGFTRRWLSDYGEFQTLRFAPYPEIDGRIAIVAAPH